MANKNASERDMIQQDTETGRDSTTKAQHGSRGKERESEFDTKMDFDLEDDYNTIEPR
ncbi:hypothetical protein H0W32_00850 [Patescibacteria group bacterium]|nr:hypothetical protein [Patescibacteria group bacterium]